MIKICGRLLKFLIINFYILFKYLFFTKKNIDLDNISTIVFSHNLGGGTETYIASHYLKDNFLMIRLLSYRCDIFFELDRNGQKLIITKKQLLKKLESVNYETVIVNSLVAYSNMSFWLDFLSNNFIDKTLLYLVHDYHCICENYVLTMYGKYCKCACNECRKKNQVKQWRSLWQHFLARCDEIICFSSSSKDILLSCYDSIETKLSVVPHDLSYCEKIAYKGVCGKNIAIIGNCGNVAKGKLVLKDVIKGINRLKKNSLFIIGPSPFIFSRQTDYVHFLGKYKLDDLSTLIETNHIGIVIFPSVWPETFSYAVSEYMRLGLVIVSLMIGAQGEKLMNYDKTIFVDNMDFSTIYEKIRDLL